jgi:bifunctional DNA-binding transcriptional regulator/antitoxin component of YhaV-PrlF toxin-antitoxin module
VGLLPASGLTKTGVGRIFPLMTTTLTIKGTVALPRKLLRQQKVRAGDHLEIIAAADEPGVIELRRIPRESDPSWVDVLLACPVKGWMQRMPRRIEPMRD